MDQLPTQPVPALAYWLPSSATLVSLCILVVLLSLQWYKSHREVAKVINKIPGPYAIPILGNVFDINIEAAEIFNALVALCTVWGSTAPLVRIWLGPHPVVIVTSPAAAEAVLGSNKHISKSSEYRFLHPWLGTGLLTSAGEKWHSRRKLLTPAFHFKILEDFIEIFNEQSLVLVNKFHTAMLKHGSEGFNIFPFITRCTLDIICDTAMGRHVDAQGHEESEYVKAVYRIGAIIQSRQILPWLQPNLLFKLTHYASEQKRCLEILHGFTNQVIQEKKIEHQCNNNATNDQSDTEHQKEQKKPKRMAFLDLLISASDGGRLLSDADIREEVDTFMFEGHDTTAAATSWCMFLVGSYPEIQERVYEEIQQVLGTDPESPIIMQDLARLKYLECCIKEALRLYPSVPLMGRELKEDVHIQGYDVSAGSTAVIFPYALHRIPTIFPDPEAFIPERFLPDNCRGRHPYAYVPFSAGPRNCIGQKFALMEEKVVLAHVFRRFQVKALEKREDICLLGELILRPRDGLRVSLTVRNPN